MKSAKKSARCLVPLLLLGLSLFSSVMLHVPGTQASTDKQVRQAVLLIRQSTQTQSSYMFPVTVAAAMNVSHTVFNADQAALTNATLYDGQVGKFSLIAITPGAVENNLNAMQRSLLDTYEEQFGVAEVLLGSVPSTLLVRYGVSSLGATPRFTCLRWASNALTNFMNTGMYVTTLTTNTTVYAYGGNETQTNPVIWSYFSGNKIRIASSIRSLSPYIGDSFASFGAFWLACKLSSANKILKFYWSIDIDDIDEQYSDSGICGAPPVSNLYFNGSDVNYMVANFLTQSGFNPTLAVDYYDVNNISMVTTYPALYNALMSNKDRFDFTPHSHQLGGAISYNMALSIIRGDRNAMRSWGFQPTLYYMVPGKGQYTNTTAPAITDSPVWYLVQGYSTTSDTVPYIKQKLSIFDVWSPTLFRVVRGWIGWMDWNLRTSQQVLNNSGHGTWDEYWVENLYDLLYVFPRIWGGYRIEMTHFQNWAYGRESANAPGLQLLKNMTGIGIVPVVPSRSWAMAETYYFIRNFKFNATYDISQNTLTYSMLKNNAAARDRITLILEGKARPVDFDPLMLKYDQNSTIVTFNSKTSITLKLGEQEMTNPYVANYQTSLLTNSSLSASEFSFEISAPLGTTSTTEVYAGVRGKPLQVFINGVQCGEGENWVYGGTSNFVTVKWTHSTAANIVIAWRAPPSTHLVTRGADNRIYYRGYNPTSNSWENWSVIPYGSTLDGPASAIVDNQVYVVVRGTNYDQIWFSYINLTDNSFSGWELLSGATPSAPTLTSNGTTLCLVVRGESDIIWYRFYNIASGIWGDWVSVPDGATQDTPAAALLGGTLQVAVRGVNYDQMWHCYVNLTESTFGGWTLMSGATPSAPTLTTNGTSLCLMVRGETDLIWYRFYDFATKAWSDWTALPGGATIDSPAATFANNQLQVVVRGMNDDQIWHGYVNLTDNTFSDWTLVDGATPSKPTLTS